MQGPDKTAIVVRKMDGQLETKVVPHKATKDRHPILGLPLIRGVVNFGSAMISAVQALYWSADFYPENDKSSAA